jgi:hypothetical protein
MPLVVVLGFEIDQSLESQQSAPQLALLVAVVEQLVLALKEQAVEYHPLHIIF